MIDAVGAPQSVLLLGASSDIGAAIVAELAGRRRLTRVVLAGRPSGRRDAAVDRVRALPPLGGAAVEVVDFDATSPHTHADVLGPVFDGGDVDVAVVAFGVLPTPDHAADPQRAAEVVTTNFTGSVAALTVLGERMRAQGHGVLVVLSSVAGERPRRSNYLYGATKAGLDAFATGLGDDLHGSGVTVLVVRPGFVRTSMTEGMTEAPLSVDATDVARAVAAHLRGPSRTVWVPGTLRVVMSALRHLPRPVFRRLPI